MSNIKNVSSLRSRLIMSAGILFTLTLSGAAAASAYGYGYWGVHSFKDAPIPSGQLLGVVEGKHLKVEKAGGNFLSAGNMCNWKLDVDFYDRSGNRYDNISSGVVSGCTHAGTRKFTVNRTMKEGRACVRLYTAFDHRVASVCHNIVR